MNRTDARNPPSRLRDDGLDMMLLLDPEGPKRWVEEAPLRLVAAAVVDVGRRTKTADLREKLCPAVISHDYWDRWWKRVQPALKDSPQFEYDGRKGTRLKGRVEEVDSVSFRELAPPAKSKPAAGSADKKKTNAATRLADWVTWLHADDIVLMPTGASGPPDALIQVVQKTPAVLTPRAVERLAGAIEERVVYASNPPKSAPLYLDCLAAGLVRLSELREVPAALIRRVVTLTARLLEATDRGECESIVIWLADYVSKGDDNAGTTASVLLLASRESPHGAQRLVGKVHNYLGEPGRIAFWKQLLALNPGHAVSPPVEGWLRNLTPDDRSAVVSSLLVAVRNEDAAIQLDSILPAVWKMANANQRHQLFDAIALKWLLHASLLPDTETIVHEVAASFDRNGQGKVDSLVSEPWRKMAQSAARQEVERVRKYKDEKIAELDGQLRDTEAELERVRKQARHFQGELQNATHRAALEVSGNAIEVLGGALQNIAARTSPIPTEVADIKAKIELALLTLNAELFGEVSEIEPYEPSLHEVDPVPTLGTRVRVTAPGVRYKVSESKSRVMLKKRAQTEVQS